MELSQHMNYSPHQMQSKLIFVEYAVIRTRFYIFKHIIKRFMHRYLAEKYSHGIYQ